MFNSIRKNLRCSVALLLPTIATVSALLTTNNSPLAAQFAQPNQFKNLPSERGRQLLAQLPPDYLLMGSVTSDSRPQGGQKNRSSGNFNVQGTAERLLWVVLDGQSPNPNIRFNIMQDRAGRRDPVLARGLYHGATTKNIFPGRSIYIANPSGTRGYFQVRAYRIAQ